MKMYSLLILLLAFFARKAFAQNDKTSTSHVKTCYQVRTQFFGNRTYIDTVTYEEMNPAQKKLIIRNYESNKVYSTVVVELDKKGQTRNMQFFQTGYGLNQKSEYFYDQRGLVIQTIDYNYTHNHDGSLKEMRPDTTNITYDNDKNKISTENRNSRIEYTYNTHNQLIRQDFYNKIGGKFQRNTYRYQENQLMEMLGYWYDGKIYTHQVYEYDSSGHLTSSMDSTTNSLLLKQLTYDQAGRLSTETWDETYKTKQSHTTFTNTYTPQGKIATRSIHTNDKMLTALSSVRMSTPLAGDPPYDLKETYKYDQYGNRLKITSELNGQMVKILDFLMTYYP